MAPSRCQIRGGMGPDMKGRRYASGLTLIEIMAVVVIVGLLGTLVGYNVNASLERAKQAKTQAQLSMIESALEHYQIAEQEYPTTREGLTALVPRYLRRRSALLDGWNRPFQYRRPAEESPFPYDLWSWGRDGEPGGTGLEADVLGWDSPEGPT